MTRVMLDSNICIYLFKRQPPSVMARFASYRKGQVLISAVTWAEICCGLDKDDNAATEQFLQRIEVANFDVAAAQWFGRLSRLHPHRKKSFDRMIAAHALALDVTLVTNNTADFAIYENSGLRLDNWASD